MVNNEFISLCSKAWTLQVLAYMHSQCDPRISPMTHHLSASRTSISAALRYLVELGYLRKNSGHGHPLRPAYVFTPKGKDAAAWASQLNNMLEPAQWKIARRTWALPILRVTSPESRFGELRSKLSPVTDRALSETLKMLSENHWLRRCVDVEHVPPSVSYIPEGTGEILVPLLQESLFI